MLKLGGWPRLTWGLRPRLPVGIRVSGVYIGLHPHGDGRRRTGRLSDRSTTRHSRPQSASQTLRPVKPEGSEGQAPHPAEQTRARRVREQLTPRQACPRPNGLGRNLRSKTRWFTGFCNSHHVSHFATFFIDARAEISVAESHFMILGRRTHGTAVIRTQPLKSIPWRQFRAGF